MLYACHITLYIVNVYAHITTLDKRTTGKDDYIEIKIY